MVKDGISRLASMQCSDGGWGWFSGWGEQSWPHTTAYVVHGLQIARACDVALLPGMIERGVDWLQRYQAEQNQLIRNAEKKEKGILWKEHADNLDAFVYMVLADEGAKYDNLEMRGYLYRDRNGLAVYAKAMFGLALHKLGDTEKRDMLLRNIDQFLVQDDENQTAYLNLPADNWWWCWYGSEYEAQAYYLKLLAAVEPKGEKASRLVKYLINNRRHATLLEQHPRHGGLRRGLRRLPEGQRRGQAGHDRDDPPRRQGAEGSPHHAARTSSPSTTSSSWKAGRSPTASTPSSSSRKAPARSTSTPT